MQRVQLESTLLASARYHPRSRLLDVAFRSGELYRYFNVPANCYEELLNAESKGQYFNQFIRNCYPYKHLSRPSSPVVLARSNKALKW